MLYFCFFCLGVDCMNFFLKYILWIPADHKILMVRLFFWAFGSIACAKEYYEFISNRNCKRVGPYLWMLNLALGVEFSIAIKFGFSMFTEPFPWYVQLMWAVISVLLTIGQIYSLVNQLKKKDEEKPMDLQEPTIDIEPVYAKKNN